MAVAPDGHVWLVNKWANTLLEFDSARNYLQEVGIRWNCVSDNTGFCSPTSIAFDAYGNRFISDSDNHRIQVYGSNGVYQTTIGETGVAGSDNVMLPVYKKLTGFFRDRGIRHVLVDSDGNIWKLMPLFIEGGVTGIYPFEVMAGMNVAEVRRAFPRLQIQGGIDKIALARGPQGITEALADVPWMLAQGGYIPYLDHLVPPDVSWENFRTYRRRLDALIDQKGFA